MGFNVVGNGKSMTRINYVWRLIATAISFICFGVGGVVLWLLIFPISNQFPGSQQIKVNRNQRMVHYSFYIFIGIMHRLGIMTYEVVGVEKLNRPKQLVVANHPTLIDVVFLLSRIKHASCIVKAELLNNPAMRGSILNAGYISNANSEMMIEQCSEYLKSGGCLIIFPEGTRSQVDKPSHFQRGSAVIALQSNCIITPVTITCNPSTLTKAEAWYQIPKQKFHLRMVVGDDIDFDEFYSSQSRPIAVRRLTEKLTDYFTKTKKHYE
jgi:1-acyl-sn-glycerol-3-phosphate acyltransferase